MAIINDTIKTATDKLIKQDEVGYNFFHITDLGNLFVCRSKSGQLSADKKVLEGLVFRLVEKGILHPVCNGTGVYAFEGEGFRLSEALEQAAAKLSTGYMAYVSMQSQLSAYGIISQSTNALYVVTNGKPRELDTRYGKIIFFNSDSRRPIKNTLLDTFTKPRIWGLRYARPALAMFDLNTHQKSQLSTVDNEMLEEVMYEVYGDKLELLEEIQSEME